MTVFDPRPASMSRGAFADRFGGIYEHSRWVAEQAWDAGLGVETDAPEGLGRALQAQVDAADREAKLTLLRAHPDLAGKLALAGGLTAESSSEQAGAGLDACTPEELEEFQSLNEAYKAKFGFPYIIAVRGMHRTEILKNFRKRADNDVETEFAEALEQVRRIALLRLERMT